MNGEPFPPAAPTAAPEITRRRFLGLVAVACAGNLAGCISQTRATAADPAMRPGPRLRGTGQAFDARDFLAALVPAGVALAFEQDGAVAQAG